MSEFSYNSNDVRAPGLFFNSKTSDFGGRPVRAVFSRSVFQSPAPGRLARRVPDWLVV
jgi:hypothetical protein